MAESKEKGLNLNKTLIKIKENAGFMALVVLIIGMIQLGCYILIITGNSNYCNYHYVDNVIVNATTFPVLVPVTRLCAASSYRGGFGVWIAIDLVFFLGIILYIFGLGQNIQEPLGDYIGIVLMVASVVIIIKNLIYVILIIWDLIQKYLFCPCIIFGAVLLIIIDIGYIVYIVYMVLMSNLLTTAMKVLKIQDAYNPKNYKHKTEPYLIEAMLGKQGINVKSVLYDALPNDVSAYEKLNNEFSKKQKKILNDF